MNEITIKKRVKADMKIGTKFDSSAPFGGYKASGYGREKGSESLENYLQTKTVWLNMSA